jgi:hypothetical protein
VQKTTEEFDMQGPLLHSDDADATGSRSDAMSRRHFLCRTTMAAAAGAATLVGGHAVAQSRPDSPLPRGATAPGRGGLLDPQQNGTRNLLDISGLWQFQLDPREEGEAAGWFRALPAPRPLGASAPAPKAVEAGTRFFRQLCAEAHRLDGTRPVTLVGVQGGPPDWHGLFDVVCINRYYGCYTQPGRLDEAEQLLGRELDALHQSFGKPIVMTKFGTDTLPGAHHMPPEMWTKENADDEGNDFPALSISAGLGRVQRLRPGRLRLSAEPGIQPHRDRRRPRLLDGTGHP